MLVRLRYLLSTLAVLAVPALVAGCGDEDENSGAAERLSRPEAIARIDAVCRRTATELERAGPEPGVGSGSRLALARYARWQARATAAVEAGIRGIEQVPIPDDSRKGEIRSFLYFSRKLISAGRGLLRAVRVGDEDEAERLSWELDSSSDQASFAARRYGLRRCGG